MRNLHIIFLIHKVGKRTIACVSSLEVANHLMLILAWFGAQDFPADNKIICIGQLPDITSTSMPNFLS